MNCRAAGRRVAVSPELEVEINRVTGLWSRLRSRYAERGPWLFGEFSIADCMFAPVVSRFRTYDITVPDDCSGYMAHVLANDSLAAWYRQAREESETIEDSEAGLA